MKTKRNTIRNRTRTVLTLAVVAMASLVLTTNSASAGIIDGLVEYWEFDGDYSAKVNAGQILMPVLSWPANGANTYFANNGLPNQGFGLVPLEGKYVPASSRDASLLGRPDNLAIWAKSKNPERARAYAGRLEEILGVPPVHILDLSPVVGVHNGIGAIGIGLTYVDEG